MTIFTSEIAMKIAVIRDERDYPERYREPFFKWRDTPYSRRRIESRIGPGCFPRHIGSPTGKRLYTTSNRPCRARLLNRG